MEELAFDNGIISSHPIYSLCGSTLDTVSKKDYPGEDFFDKSIRCLDMDVYETQTCHGNKSHTMDAAIGIKSYSNNKFHATRLLLVELRMDYKSEKKRHKKQDTCQYDKSFQKSRVSGKSNRNNTPISLLHLHNAKLLHQQERHKQRNKGISIEKAKKPAFQI